MIRPRLLGVLRTCFRPASPIAFIGVPAYVAYLGWLAMYEIGMIGDTAYVHMCLLLATAGAWVGAYAGRLARWPGFRFIPGFAPVLGTVTALVSISVLLLNGVAARIGGIDPWPLAPLGALALAAGLVGGRARPASAYVLFVSLGVLIPLGPLLDRLEPLLVLGAKTWPPIVAALVVAVALLVWFASRLRLPRVRPSPPSVTALPPWITTFKFLPRRFREPSMGRITVLSGLLATGCSIAHRHPGFEWPDGSLIILIGCVCAILGATGISASHSRGPVPGTAWLLLWGAAKGRPDAARRMLAGTVANYFLAGGVFAAVTVALGPDWHLVKMMMVALAASHVYLAAACPFRWLLSNRVGPLVAMPVVVAITWTVWTLIPWELPTAFVACVLTGVAAVYLGGFGMARLDLDPVAVGEPVR